MSRPTVSIWIIDLLGRVPAAEWLDSAELARAERFHCPGDRQRFLASRGALRQILARAANLPPSSIRYRHGPHGKPRLRSGNLHFSLSRSGDLAVAAVSDDGELGIDIERVTANPNADESAALVLSPEEAMELGKLAPPEQPKAFFQFWTCKEAYLKAIGTGLQFPPKAVSIELSATGARLPRLRAGAEGFGDWALTFLDPGRPDYCCALAVSGGPPRLCIHQWRATPPGKSF